jgi:hypothetical protein
MEKESPLQSRTSKIALVAAAALVVVLAAGCGPEKFKGETTGSEQYMEKVQSGQPMYTPPPGAPVPGAPLGGGAPGGAPGGMPSGAPTAPPPTGGG